MDSPLRPDEDQALPLVGRARLLKWLRAVPGVARMRVLRPGLDSQVGILVDAFASFATLDGALSAVEADLILDMLRSAFSEVDHGWLARRLQRAVRSPRPLQVLASELRITLDEPSKLALGMQLFTLVDAAGRSERSRASYEVFMRRLGKPAFGSAILQEMRGPELVSEVELPFERLIFGGEYADVELPPEASTHEFRVYRASDLILVRNTGMSPLWIRGRSVESGSYLRLRERQPLVVPGWSLDYDDLLFFLDVKRTGNAPSIYLSSGDDDLAAERVKSRQSELRVKFGLKAEIQALRDTSLRVGTRWSFRAGETLDCPNHERISSSHGFSLSINELRQRALRSGRRFRLVADRLEFRVSNDASELGSGDLLLGPKLAPKTVLFISYDPVQSQGNLRVRESNGPIHVDGVPVRFSSPLKDDSVIRLSGSQAVRCRFSEGFLDEERTLIESLRVDGLIHDFGRGQRALDQVNFEVKRGEMLCIIGPSGSGKSTLLAVLSGQRKPGRGSVLLNGIPLYEKREHLVPFIAYMPQEEALNPQLTVREHLRHAVTIRRPALSLAEHERRVDSMLAELGLQSIANREVGTAGDKTLSGGERGRLNLGLDLGSRAEVFLFDEPISGLSSKDSEHVAETLRALAREKIVIASLHRPGAPVLNLFDKVLLLDNGGRVAYFGTPDQMVRYFREACEELGISYTSESSNAALGADFVFDVLETPLSTIGGAQMIGAARRFPPTFWQERFESLELMSTLRGSARNDRSYGKGGSDPETLPIPPRPSRRLHALLAVFATHFLRSFLSKVRNRGTIYSTCLEAPLLAALTSITLRSSETGPYQFSTGLHIPAYLFLSATVAMFLGLTNTATEVLRDRPMLRRERNCQPGAFTYVWAKFGALAVIAATQCLIYLVVGNHFLEIEGMLIQHWLWMTLTACTGTAMALFVSSIVRTERAALTAVPLLLVPQMLLAGALVPYREMNRGLFVDASEVRGRGGIPVPAMVMPLRYSFEAMVVAQAVRNPFEVERTRLQRRIDRVRYRGSVPDEEILQRFDLVKEGLRRLVASGATDKHEAAALVKRIRRNALDGSKLEVETMKIWPDKEAEGRPTSEFFVNNRIDLLVREAETFRTDYRNKTNRNVFLALEKPLPWASKTPPSVEGFPDQPGQVETLRYCGMVLGLVISFCLGLTMLSIGWQNRSTR